MQQYLLLLDSINTCGATPVPLDPDVPPTNAMI
ncbi:MAG: hypothetical protein CM15mV7_2430 [uncultured marine virus]|nr:MAG: hypothetical protein CM15mV7_2430 [uncultured marine virus]